LEPYYKNKNCKLYQCDNLELLKSIKDNYIDLIYCDILYGTGIKFEDYQDLKPIRQDIEEHYIPRFSEMKRVLKGTGSIYLQMDYKISHWIRIILDDIFGYNNLRNEIIWCYSMAGNAKRYFPKKHDNIFWYSKSDNWCFNVESVRVPYKDGKPHGQGKANWNDSFDLEAQAERGKVVEDWWSDISPVGRIKTELNGYSTQKPKKLLNRIISASSNVGDIVADFYMGSGTTGEVSVELNRRFIGCDIGDNACQIAKERLEKFVTP